jgi:hypothetical protein
VDVELKKTTGAQACTGTGAKRSVEIKSHHRMSGDGLNRVCDSWIFTFSFLPSSLLVSL